MELDLMVDEATAVECPHCGATNELVLDPSGRRQRYVTECQVCDRDIDIRVDNRGGAPLIHALAA